MFFKSKKTIEFFNETPGVAELMPIIPAKDYKHPWAERALEDFSKLRQNPFWKHQPTSHTARCPGIFSLQRHGWIVRTWQDIEIETNGDGRSVVWRSATTIGGDPVHFHDESELANFFKSWPDDTLRTVIKIHTGWKCTVPKGYYLLEMPIPLVEDYRFSIIPGYFYKEAGLASMNSQLLWHVMKGKTLIKAGTPIAQYILVPKEFPEMICRDAKPEDKLELVRLLHLSRFVKNYGEFKKLFS